MGRDLINPVVARWLDGKCQRLLATALKVQHCWTLKTTVGDCWRQSPTCAGDSRQLKYKHTRDCRRLSPSRATVGDWSINQALVIRMTYGGMICHPDDILQCPKVIRMRYGQGLTHPDDLGVNIVISSGWLRVQMMLCHPDEIGWYRKSSGWRPTMPISHPDVILPIVKSSGWDTANS